MEEKGTSLHICVPITSFDWAIACTLAQTFSLNLISWILTCTQHEHYKRKKENQWVCGVGDWRFGSAAKADSWAVHTAQLHMSTHICTHTLAHAHTRARARTSNIAHARKRRDEMGIMHLIAGQQWNPGEFVRTAGPEQSQISATAGINDPNTRASTMIRECIFEWMIFFLLKQ